MATEAPGTTPSAPATPPHATPDGEFLDSLDVRLGLTLGSASFDLTAGSVEALSVDLHVWGFEASVRFFVSSEQVDDPLFAAFCGTARLALSLTATREIQGDDEQGKIAIYGYAVARSVREVVGGGVAHGPVVRRRYQVTFVDPAQAVWRTHAPVELYVKSSLQDVLDAQKPAGIVVTSNWGKVTEKQPVFCLPLDASQGVTFYDFLVGWIDRCGGVFEFDGVARAYRIAAKKAEAKNPTPLDAETVRELSVVLPEPPRFLGRVMNGVAEAPTRTEVANPLAFPGVRHDLLVRSPIAGVSEGRAQQEEVRAQACDSEVVVSFSRCPDAFVAPGQTLSLGEGFSKNLFASGKTYRLNRLRLRGEQATPDENEETDTTVVYRAHLTYDAEIVSSRVPRLPPFHAPPTSIQVEGKIVSVGGEPTDRTWGATENSDTSLWAYKVEIPLFNLEVPAPFLPNFQSGHFFFPAYKNQRVLVTLGWDRAEIAGFLDWAAEGRLPSDSQGNQIVMGPKLGNGTVIRHTYVDAKPVLRVERKTDEETQVISIADGNIRISLQEAKVPPAKVPTFDVTPQVAAAKDMVAGKVEGGVAALTAQFEASAGKVSAAVDDASSSVSAQIGATEKALGAKIDAAEATLNEATGAGSAALAGVTEVVTKAKSDLASVGVDLTEAKAPLIALVGRLDALAARTKANVATLEGELATLGKRLMAPIDRAAAEAAASRASVDARAAAVRRELASLGAPTSGESPTVASQRAKLEGERERLETKVLPPLVAAPEAVEEARRTLTKATEDARAALSTVLQSVTTGVAALDTLRAPLTGALTALDTAEQTVRAATERARATVDTMEQAVAGALQKGIATMQALVDGGLRALEKARVAVGLFGAKIMPPVDALKGLVDELQTLFGTLTRAIDAFMQQATSVLGAIKATGLPKPLVAPATQAIQAAAKTLVPAIDVAVKQGGTQLNTLARSLEPRVASARDKALSAVGAFEKETVKTIDGIVAPIAAQLATAQRALDEAVETFRSNATALVDGAKGEIARVGTAATSHATSAMHTGAATVTDAEKALGDLVEAARTQLAGAGSRLDAQAGALADRITRSIEQE